MFTNEHRRATAFSGNRCIAAGDIADVAMAVRSAMDAGDAGQILIFSDHDGQQSDVDLRGNPQEVRARFSPKPEHADDKEAAEAPRGRGRPKLGVVAREVTLLPRHWEWLNDQPGGASVALRKLVDQARRSGEAEELQRKSRDAAYRAMSVLAGNEQGFEEASRALFAGDHARFSVITSHWSGDVSAYVQRLLHGAGQDA